MTNKVTVYSKPDCMQCNFTKKWLKERNIPFTELNVKEDEDALSKIKEMGYQAVPVIVTETENWYGFQPDKLAKLVE
ncbi:glutaredoxin-like protein NrdH [Carnobacterium sp. 1290_CSPC]|uniref:glutaredoxin-like protein NrdH n=1 Tax=Carnobacterium sp. 1290_CSPC TaxID=1579347 RepID=UPI0006600F17|nr:glutaredoxin-like protein NrdH [Carnobacterium sp. 1290_CSPC]